MNYYLAFKLKNNEFKKIPLGVKSLSGIDEFTSGFENEQKLREFLALHFVPESILDNKDFTKDLVINYKYKNEKYLHKPFGIIYRDDYKFLDVEYLKHYMLSKINNLEFVDLLYKNFNGYYYAKNHLNVLNQLVMEKANGYYNSAYGDLDKLNKMIMEEMYNTFEGIICESQKNKTTGMYEKHISYRNLHCLSAFCADYEKKRKLQKEILAENEISLNDINSINDDTDEYVLDSFGHYSEDFIEEAKKHYNPDDSDILGRRK